MKYYGLYFNLYHKGKVIKEAKNKPNKETKSKIYKATCYLWTSSDNLRSDVNIQNKQSP